jgi:hypothetical protein
MSKSGVVGKNKHGKPTTAAKNRKKREQKRKDRACNFDNDPKKVESDKFLKHEDAWMYEAIGNEQRTIAQVKQELKHVEQELAWMDEHAASPDVAKASNSH